MSRFDPAALKAISEGWRRSKATSHHELRFLVRPLPLEDEPGVRKFVLVDADGVPEAFAAFDPVYEGGAVTSYLSYTRRWLPSAGPLASYALVRAAIETFQREGVATLHLGLSPFHRIVDAEFQKAWVVKRAFRFLYTNRLANRWVYPLRSLAWHKDSFGGEARQSYCAINTMPALPRLLKLLLACRIV